MAKHFMLSEHQPMMRLALLLRHLPLSLHEAYLFCVSPTDPDDTPIASALLAMATAYCSRCGTYPTAGVLLHTPAAHALLEVSTTTLLRCCLGHMQPAICGVKEPHHAAAGASCSFIMC